MKKSSEAINGLLLLDKPRGISSNQAVGRVKRLFNAAKVGHTGTLDPEASGLLPLCLGEATKFASYLLEGDKEYLARVRLGITTTTGDSEGEIIAEHPVRVTVDQLSALCVKFCGEMEQVPPMYSALKHNGQPLYAYARLGVEIDRPARKVMIYEVEISDYDPLQQEFTLRALVSKGTYIRTLAEDIGVFLGCGASLTALRRTKTNNFNLDYAYTIDQLEEFKAAGDLACRLLPIDTLTSSLAKLSLTPSQFAVISFGNILYLDEPLADLELNSEVNLFAGANYLGVGRYLGESGRWLLHPRRLVANLTKLTPWP